MNTDYGLALLELTLLFAISTAKTCVGPNMLERKTSHYMSGVKVTFGSRV